MKVYIASPYERKATINRQIYEELTRANIEAFLPEKININTSLEKTKEQYKVGDICYDEIEKCDIILGVWEFGRSVSAEIGSVILKNRKEKKEIKVVIFDTKDKDIDILKNEVMIWPFVDRKVESISELIDYLTNLGD